MSKTRAALIGRATSDVWRVPARPSFSVRKTARARNVMSNDKSPSVSLSGE